MVGRVFALVVMLTTIGCDRVTKHLATTNLADRPAQAYLADNLRFEYAENPGAFLSLGSRLPQWVRTSLFKVGVGFALAAISFVALKHRWIGSPLVGASLVFAGGVSNLVDRIARGSVVDFMSVGVGPLRTGIFNVADVALMIGIALIVIDGGGLSGPDDRRRRLRTRPPRAAEPAAAADESARHPDA